MHQTPRPQSRLADRPQPGDTALAKARAALEEAQQLVAACEAAQQLPTRQQVEAQAAGHRRGLPQRPPP